jgi:hypothetical protein
MIFPFSQNCLKHSLVTFRTATDYTVRRGRRLLDERIVGRLQQPEEGRRQVVMGLTVQPAEHVKIMNEILEEVAVALKSPDQIFQFDSHD